MKSKFMDELTKDIVVENAKKVQEEEKAEAEEKKITADITVSDYDALSDSFKVSLSKVKCQLPVESIQCTVWKSDGMKALVWYEAEKQEDGTYSIEVKAVTLRTKKAVMMSLFMDRQKAMIHLLLKLLPAKSKSRSLR